MRCAVLLLALAASASAMVNDTCQFTPAVFTSTSCGLSAPGIGILANGTASVAISGTIMNKVIIAGTMKYQIWESGVTQFIGSGNLDYFVCNNKGCDPTQPLALTLASPNSPNSAYSLAISFTVPSPKNSGNFMAVVWGEDQDHTYDFTAEIAFSLNCRTDADCPATSYCMNDPSKVPPYNCH